MRIGKTTTTVTKEDIMSKLTEVDILTSLFPEVKSIPCLICSPLRNDTKPSFSIYAGDSGRIYWKDHSTKERGDIFTLLCRYWKCELHEVYRKIDQCCLRTKVPPANARSKIPILTRRESNDNIQIHVAVREWRDYDISYWTSYGITKKWLEYAEVYPISHKIVIKKVGDSYAKYIFPADKFAYCFIERKEGNVQLKIYQPYNKNGYKWCSKMDGSVIGLWDKIPEFGDRVIICSSLKDALCVSCQLKIPTLCLQGEGYSMSKTAINELKRRYKRIYISFDVDKAGIEDSKKLSKETGFINVIPDLHGEKDFSDYYKSLKNKENFKQLRSLFC